MADAVSASLNRDTAILVLYLVVTPDPTERYAKLKERLNTLFGESQEEKLQ